MTQSGIDLFGAGAKFDHIGVAVESIASILHQGEVVDDPEQNVRVAFADVHGLRLELIEPMSEASPISSALEKGSRLVHICYRVPSLDKAIRCGRRSRVFLISPPVPAAAFGGRKIAWMFSQSLGLFELVEAAPAAAEGKDRR